MEGWLEGVSSSAGGGRGVCLLHEAIFTADRFHVDVCDLDHRCWLRIWGTEVCEVVYSSGQWRTPKLEKNWAHSCFSCGSTNFWAQKHFIKAPTVDLKDSQTNFLSDVFCLYVVPVIPQWSVGIWSTCWWQITAAERPTSTAEVDKWCWEAAANTGWSVGDDHRTGSDRRQLIKHILYKVCVKQLFSSNWLDIYC